MLHQVRWLTMTPFELKMSHAKFSLLSRREFQSISRVLSHDHCSCPLAGRLEKHRSRLARPRCGPQHVSQTFYWGFFFIHSQQFFSSKVPWWASRPGPRRLFWVLRHPWVVISAGRNCRLKISMKSFSRRDGGRSLQQKLSTPAWIFPPGEITNNWTPAMSAS